jgi:hypothetical protein
LSSRVGFWVSSAATVVLLASLAGCGGDDGNDNDSEERPRPVAGTFVGKLRGADELVAVVAALPAKGEDRREVEALICAANRTCALFSGTASGNTVVAKSPDGDAQTEVRLSGEAAKGSVTLPDGRQARYVAREGTATAGLYDLTVSPPGRVTGASADGVGLTGQVKLPPPGRGQLELADGTRLRFEVTESSAGDEARLRTGQLRLIVLPGGDAVGAGKARGGDGGTAFVVRSTPK